MKLPPWMLIGAGLALGWWLGGHRERQRLAAVNQGCGCADSRPAPVWWAR